MYGHAVLSLSQRLTKASRQLPRTGPHRRAASNAISRASIVPSANRSGPHSRDQLGARRPIAARSAAGRPAIGPGEGQRPLVARVEPRAGRPRRVGDERLDAPGAIRDQQGEPARRRLVDHQAPGLASGSDGRRPRRRHTSAQLLGLEEAGAMDRAPEPARRRRPRFGGPRAVAAEDEIPGIVPAARPIAGEGADQAGGSSRGRID